MTSGVDLDTQSLLNLRYLAGRMRDVRTPPRSTVPGDVRHRRRGRGLEVHDVRPWVDGDDIRNLDQNATARTGVPHTKTFFDERERAILVVADFRPSMLFGTRRAFRSVAAAEAAMILGWRGVAHGGRVGVMTVGARGTRFSRQGRGERAMIAAAGVLAEAHREALADPAARDPDLVPALDTAATLASTGSALIVVSALDETGPGFADAVRRITRRHDLIFLLVEDAFEQEPPTGDYPFSTAEGHGGWLRILANRPPPPDRVAELRRLGASALRFSSALPAEQAVAALEHVGG